MSKRHLSVSVVAGGDQAVAADELSRFARKAEAAGYYKLYVTDHIFHSTPTFHSATAFAVIAAATTTIGLGFGSYIVPFRHPIVAAKELAFLDGLSGGRLTAGLAAGSSKAEFEAFGLAFNTRGRQLDEGIDAMRRLWTEDAVSFAGEFYTFKDVSLRPRPVQSPHPPIWIGSWTGSRPAARRIVTHASGWQSSALHASLDEATQGWRRIEDMCAEMGRDPASIGRAMVNLVARVGDNRAKAMATIIPSHRMHDELIVAGTASAVADRLLEIYASGIDEVSVFLPLNAIGQLDAFAEQVMPRLAG